MYTVNRVRIGLCVLHMLKIFPASHEPEVEGDRSHDVDAV